MSDEYTRLIIQQELISFGLIDQDAVNKKHKRAQYAESEFERAEIEEGIAAGKGDKDLQFGVGGATPMSDTSLPKGLMNPPDADQGTYEPENDPVRQAKVEGKDQKAVAEKERKEIDEAQKKEADKGRR